MFHVKWFYIFKIIAIGMRDMIVTMSCHQTFCYRLSFDYGALTLHYYHPILSTRFFTVSYLSFNSTSNKYPKFLFSHLSYLSHLSPSLLFFLFFSLTPFFSILDLFTYQNLVIFSLLTI